MMGFGVWGVVGIVDCDYELEVGGSKCDGGGAYSIYGVYILLIFYYFGIQCS